MKHLIRSLCLGSCLALTLGCSATGKHNTFTFTADCRRTFSTRQQQYTSQLLGSHAQYLAVGIHKSYLIGSGVRNTNKTLKWPYTERSVDVR